MLPASTSSRSSGKYARTGAPPPRTPTFRMNMTPIGSFTPWGTRTQPTIEPGRAVSSARRLDGRLRRRPPRREAADRRHVHAEHDADRQLHAVGDADEADHRAGARSTPRAPARWSAASASPTA